MQTPFHHESRFAPPSKRWRGVFAYSGFTLVEILLAMGIFIVLAGVVSFTMFGSLSDRYLEDGADRFGTLIRMVRAEAANQGRKMRISWNAAEDRMLVEWEPQPLAQPGQFVEFEGASWVSLVPNDMVRIVGNHREGATEEDALTFGGGQSASQQAEAKSQSIIDFYPDGSCDSTKVELASRDESDTRRALVEMDSINTTVTSRLLDSIEYAQWQEEMNVSSEMSRGY